MEIKGYLTKLNAVVLFCFVIFPMVIVVSGNASTYEWVDKDGSAHYTDDPATIPSEYLKKVRRHESSDDKAPAAPTAISTPSQQPEKKAAERILFGNHDQKWWRGRFKELRDDLKETEQRLPALKQRLTETARHRTMFHKSGDRIEYNNIKDEIIKTEERVKDLQQQLQDIDDEAAKVGVPRDWRE